jgi:hypothetical protein
LVDEPNAHNGERGEVPDGLESVFEGPPPIASLRGRRSFFSEGGTDRGGSVDRAAAGQVVDPGVAERLDALQQAIESHADALHALEARLAGDASTTGGTHSLQGLADLAASIRALTVALDRRHNELLRLYEMQHEVSQQIRADLHSISEQFFGPAPERSAPLRLADRISDVWSRTHASGHPDR